MLTPIPDSSFNNEMGYTTKLIDLMADRTVTEQAIEAARAARDASSTFRRIVGQVYLSQGWKNEQWYDEVEYHHFESFEQWLAHVFQESERPPTTRSIIQSFVMVVLPLAIAGIIKSKVDALLGMPEHNGARVVSAINILMKRGEGKISEEAANQIDLLVQESYLESRTDFEALLKRMGISQTQPGKGGRRRGEPPDEITLGQEKVEGEDDWIDDGTEDLGKRPGIHIFNLNETKTKRAYLFMVDETNPKDSAAEITFLNKIDQNFRLLRTPPDKLRGYLTDGGHTDTP